MISPSRYVSIRFGGTRKRLDDVLALVVSVLEDDESGGDVDEDDDDELVAVAGEKADRFDEEEETRDELESESNSNFSS